MPCWQPYKYDQLTYIPKICELPRDRFDSLYRASRRSSEGADMRSPRMNGNTVVHQVRQVLQNIRTRRENMLKEAGRSPLQGRRPQLLQSSIFSHVQHAYQDLHARVDIEPE